MRMSSIYFDSFSDWSDHKKPTTLHTSEYVSVAMTEARSFPSAITLHRYGTSLNSFVISLPIGVSRSMTMSATWFLNATVSKCLHDSQTCSTVESVKADAMSTRFETPGRPDGSYVTVGFMSVIALRTFSRTVSAESVSRMLESRSTSDLLIFACGLRRLLIRLKFTVNCNKCTSSHNQTDSMKQEDTLLKILTTDL